MTYIQLALAAFSYVGAMAGTAAVDRALDRFAIIAPSESGPVSDAAAQRPDPEREES